MWHPFADMAAVGDSEFVIESGSGVWVYDTAGNRYLDATAGLWYANVGHGRGEIAAAIANQLARIEAYSAFGDIATPPARELAARLGELAPMDGAKAFLTTGGGEAIEAAAKLARLFFSETGSPKRTHLISRAHGYHGTAGYGTSISGIQANRLGFGELLTHTSVVDHASLEALEAEFERIGADRVAAVIVEPVIGAGGVYPPPPGYIEQAAKLCRRAGALFIADSVICGFGRLGSWFGVERFGVEPDMIAFAKGVTSGYLPLGGLMVSGRVAEPFWSRPGGPVFRHGPTYSAHATCCAAALSNLDILESEGLIGRGAQLEQDLLGSASALVRHPLVSEVRGGTGLLAACELDGELLRRRPSACFDVYQSARRAGVIVRPLASAIALSPPLTVSSEQLDLVCGALWEALDEVAELAGD